MIVDKFHSNYTISKRMGHPYQIKDQLDNILIKNLKEEFLSPLLGIDDGEEYLFIKNLDIKFNLNSLKINDGTVLNLWAAKIVSSIKEIISGPSDDKNFIRFLNYSEYLSSFIVDLLNGAAWQKWYYKEFENFKLFNKTEIINVLLSTNKEITEDILLLITRENSLDLLLNEITEEYAETFYKDYININKTNKEGLNKIISSLLELINSEPFDFIEYGFNSYKFRLKLYLQTIQKYPEYRYSIYIIDAVNAITTIKEFLSEDRISEVFDLLNTEGELYSFVKDIIDSREEKDFSNILNKIKEKTKNISKEVIKTSYGGLFLFVRFILENKLNFLISSHYDFNTFLLFLGQKLAGYKEIKFENIDPGIIFFAGYGSQSSPALLKHYIDNIHLK